MNPKERAELIRKGNAAFNEKNYDLAIRIFKATNYKDGLIRVGDFFYFEREQPLVAYGYYKQAGHEKMIDKIFDGFVFAMKCLLADDDSTSTSKTVKAAPEKAPAKVTLIETFDEDAYEDVGPSRGIASP